MRSFRSQFEPKRETGKDVLRVTDLAIGYDEVLAKVTFLLSKGQKVGIIGENGIGKSTLLKTLVGQLPALGGGFSFGYQVDVGYFDQQMAQYSSDKQVLDEFWDEFPTLTQTEVRSALGAFLFTQDEVFKKVNMLSGGERVRLALARIFKYRPNLLILDEPTNHMDIVGKETLENMLKDYKGAVLFVSHDRYFVRQVADALLVFEKGGVKFYSYGYDYYMEKVKEQEMVESESIVRKETALAKVSATSTESNTLSQSEMRERAKEEARKKRQIEKIEEQIQDKEAVIEDLKAQLLLPEYASDYNKLAQLQKEIEVQEDELEVLMENWELMQE